MARFVKFLKFHCLFRGRLNRFAYLLLVLTGYGVLLGVWSVISFAHQDFEMDNWNDAGLTVIGITMLIFVWFWFTGIIKRLHDMNRSGWWVFAPAALTILTMSSGSIEALVFVIIVMQLVVLIAIIWLFCGRGTEGDNRFGEDPRTKSIWKVILGQMEVSAPIPTEYPLAHPEDAKQSDGQE